MILVVGNPGAGKTFFVRIIVRELVPDACVYVVDPHDEYRGLIVDGPPFPEAEPRRPVIFRPRSPPYTEELELEVAAFIEHVESVGGNLVLSEIHEYVDPVRRRLPVGALSRMAFQGRKPHKCGLVLDAQQMQLVHPKLRQARVVYVFRQTAKRDIEAVDDIVPVPYGPLVAMHLPLMSDHDYVRIDLGGRPKNAPASWSPVAFGSTDRKRSATRVALPAPLALPAITGRLR